MDQPLPKRDWKKIAAVIVTAIIIPGGFIALGIYGIKKLIDKKKNKNKDQDGITS